MSETKLFRKKADKNKAPSTNSSRRKFLKGAVVTGGGAAVLGVSQIGVAQDAGAPKKKSLLCSRHAGDGALGLFQQDFEAVGHD